jgi:hypothetical protein
VWFKPVYGLKMRTHLTGLRIREASPIEGAGILQEIREDPADETHVFVVGSGAFSGFVVAGLVRTLEDDGEYFEPSGLMIEQPGIQ